MVMQFFWSGSLSGLYVLSHKWLCPSVRVYVHLPVFMSICPSAVESVASAMCLSLRIEKDWYVSVYCIQSWCMTLEILRKVDRKMSLTLMALQIQSLPLITSFPSPQRPCPSLHLHPIPSLVPLHIYQSSFTHSIQFNRYDLWHVLPKHNHHQKMREWNRHASDLQCNHLCDVLLYRSPTLWFIMIRNVYFYTEILPRAVLNSKFKRKIGATLNCIRYADMQICIPPYQHIRCMTVMQVLPDLYLF